MALTMGFVLGLTRRRPITGRLPRSVPSEAEDEPGSHTGKAASEQVG